jgi:hypothetical protein
LADVAPQQLLRCPAAARVAAWPYFSRTCAFNVSLISLPPWNPNNICLTVYTK